MTHIRNLRWVGIAEGISFLVLLLIAMPLKYFANIPEPVKYVGWAHGLLFILYIVAVLFAIKPMRWGFLSVIIAFAGSLIPLGTFVLDRSWKRRQRELEAEAK